MVQYFSIRHGIWSKSWVRCTYLIKETKNVDVEHRCFEVCWFLWHFRIHSWILIESNKEVQKRSSELELSSAVFRKLEIYTSIDPGLSHWTLLRVICLTKIPLAISLTHTYKISRWLRLYSMIYRVKTEDHAGVWIHGRVRHTRSPNWWHDYNWPDQQHEWYWTTKRSSMKQFGWSIRRWLRLWKDCRSYAFF